MAKLPVTVIAVAPKAGGLFEVTIGMADGTTTHYLVPPTLATVEAVTISALAMAMLADIAAGEYTHPHAKHRRFSPRP